MVTELDQTPNDATAIDADTATSQVAIYTTDNQSGIDMTLGTPAPPMTYVLKIYLVTEAGTSKDSSGEVLEISVIMTDPCFSATISLGPGGSGVVPSLSPTYTIGDPQDVQ